MPRLNLKGVKPRRGCGKPVCATGSRILNRHHIRHQGMWLSIWSGRRRGEPKWEEFISNYEAFHPEDTRDLCMSHHAEIHNEYDVIIQRDIVETGRLLHQYSWAQAEKLMDRLEEFFLWWVVRKTPGISSADYSKTKLRRRRRLRKKFEE